MTQEQFQSLKAQFPKNDPELYNHLHDHFYLSAVIDPEFVRSVLRLRDDFGLQNFVETGTYEGLTSWVMSPHFDRVFTCDIQSLSRRLEFWLAGNIVYRTSPSLKFLEEKKDEIQSHSLFFLDAHGAERWPLLDELKWIFAHCQSPVVAIDDYDAGYGLRFDSYNGAALNADTIAPMIPEHYKFFVNPWSRRMAGVIFLFPETREHWVDYGCGFVNRAQYDEAKHGIWK